MEHNTENKPEGVSFSKATNDSAWKCSAVCPQKIGDTYCGKTCQLNAGHYGPHICPDGHQWT